MRWLFFKNVLKVFLLVVMSREIVVLTPTNYTLLFVCVSVCANEPNAIETELKFEMSTDRWSFRSESTVGVVTPKPAYCVVLSLAYPPQGRFARWWPRRHDPNLPQSRLIPEVHYRSPWMSDRGPIDFTSNEVIKALIETTAGQSLSPEQRKLCMTGQVIAGMPSVDDNSQPADRIVLLTVSEEDAKSMTKAFLRFLQSEADKELEFYKKKVGQLEEDILTTKGKFEQTGQKLQVLQDERDELRGKMYYTSAPDARQTVSEMNKMLGATDIEVAAREAKIVAVRNAIDRNQRLQTSESAKKDTAKYAIDRSIILQRLEQMLVEESIELKSLDAKKRAVLKAKDQARKFIDLYQEIHDVGVEMGNLKDQRERLQMYVHKIQKILTDPNPYTKPPMVRNYKAVIYPIEIKD